MRLYDKIASRAGFRCEYCHAPEAMFNHRFPIDHIVPKVFGGSGDPEKPALACHSCNGHKYQKQMAVDVVSKQSTRLFNPRRDKWVKHFHWNGTRTRIIGRTAIGRATIRALNLNGARQVEAIILWQKLNSFPP